MTTFNEEIRRKAGLFLLAAACAFVAGAGLRMMLSGEAPADVLRGAGRVLLWGGAAAALLARVHGRSLPGISMAMCMGAGLIVVSWR